MAIVHHALTKLISLYFICVSVYWYKCSSFDTAITVIIPQVFKKQNLIDKTVIHNLEAYIIAFRW